ncbi:MAG: histidinol dehydrogenase [Planctomycetes bacterium]|jgi:histidinol dehydrogenase|nr:histidinol dehydrogenase [Planctomycetota bacterium]
MTSIRIIRQTDGDFDARLAELRDILRGGGLTGGGERSLDVPAVVRDILNDIRTRGDEAVIEWEETLDQATLSPKTLRVPVDEIDRARAEAECEFIALVRRVAENIRRYQEHICIAAPDDLVRDGRQLGVRYTPMDRVAVYVPGGRALYPSTVLMTVIPAQVAGVREVVMVSPPTGGDIAPMVLALAGELGVTEVYRLGGAVAVGALAYGTDAVPAAQKIVGPGNAFVAEAKRQVLGTVGIDSIAGPSEVLIVADDTARADWLAADLLAQTEHDPGSAVLVTTSEQLAGDVTAELDGQLARLSRGDAARRCLQQYSGIVVVDTLDTACNIANDFATEHLQIITADDEAALKQIRNAGAIFIGPNTPVPLGDYIAGPSHVLPTGGTAAFFGPLSVNDFLKASSTIRYSADAANADADDVIDFATREGLTAHAEAARRRKAGRQ